MSNAATDEDLTRQRKTIRLHPDTVERAKYWGSKQNLTENEYFVLAIEEKIARENGDYDLPTLEQMRLNQLIDEVRALSTNSANLEAVVTSGFGSLLGLTRGDSYLLDDEDGELGAPDTASAIAGG
jgi:hypothetical protein